MAARTQEPAGAHDAVSYLPAIDDDYTAPLAVRPAGAAKMLSIGLSLLYELLRDGELASYRVGRSRFVLVSSIHAYIARQIAAAI